MRRIVVYPVVGAVVVAGVAWWGVLTWGMPSWPWKGERAAVQTDPNAIRIWVDLEGGTRRGRAVRIGEGVYVTALHSLVGDLTTFGGDLEHRPDIYTELDGEFTRFRLALVAENLDLAAVVTSEAKPGAQSFVPITDVPEVGAEVVGYLLDGGDRAWEKRLLVDAVAERNADLDVVRLSEVEWVAPGDSGGPLYVDGMLWGVIRGTSRLEDDVVFGQPILRHAGRMHRVLTDNWLVGELVADAEAELAMIRMRDAMGELSEQLVEEDWPAWAVAVFGFIDRVLAVMRGREYKDNEAIVVEAMVDIVGRAIDAEWCTAQEFVDMAWESATEPDDSSPFFWLQWWRVVVLAAIDLGVAEVGGLPVEAAAVLVRERPPSNWGRVGDEASAAFDVELLLDWWDIARHSGVSSEDGYPTLLRTLVFGASVDDVQKAMVAAAATGDFEPVAFAAGAQLLLREEREVGELLVPSLVDEAPELSGKDRGHLARRFVLSDRPETALVIFGWSDGRPSVTQYSRWEFGWLYEALSRLDRSGDFVELCLELRNDGAAGEMEYRPLVFAANRLIEHGHADVALEVLSEVSPSAHESYIWLHEARHRAGADVVGEFRAIGSPLAEWHRLRGEE